MLSEEVMKKFICSQVAIHCPTQEAYNKLMAELGVHGLFWCEGGEFPSEVQVWNDCTAETCVIYGASGLEYDSCDYYRKIGYEIIEIPSEAQQDLETLRSLFKKYHVYLAGNLEETIEKATKKEMGNI